MGPPPSPYLDDDPELQRRFDEAWELVLRVARDAAAAAVQPVVDARPDALEPRLLLVLAERPAKLKAFVGRTLTRVGLHHEDYAMFLREGRLPRSMRDDELDEDGDEEKAEHLRDMLTDDFDVAFRKATTLEKLLLLEHENGTDEARCRELLATLEAPFELALLAAIIPWHQPIFFEVCTRFVERHPSIAFAHALLVEAYESLDDREAALRAAERGMAQAERPAYLHAAAAAHLANEGRYRDALVEIDKARADDPEWLGSELLACVMRAELGDREPLAAWIAAAGELDVLRAHHAVSLLREHGLGEQAVQLHLASPLSHRRDEYLGRESAEAARESFGLWVSPFPPAWREHWLREEERLGVVNALRAAMHLFDVRARLAAEEARQGRPEAAEDLLPRVDDNLQHRLEVAIAEGKKDVAEIDQLLASELESEVATREVLPIYWRMGAYERLRELVDDAYADITNLGDRAAMHSWRAALACVDRDPAKAREAVAQFRALWRAADADHPAVRRIARVEAILANLDGDAPPFDSILDALVDGEHVALVEPVAESRASLAAHLVEGWRWDPKVTHAERAQWLSAILLDHEAVDDVFSDDGDLSLAIEAAWS